MQKILQVLGSFFLSLFQSSHAEPLTYEKLVDDIFERLEKIMNKATFGLSGVLLIISGFLAAYFNLLNQYDQTGSISVGAVASGGLVLMLFGAVLIYVSARKPMNEKVVPSLSQGQAASTSSPSTLEQALAALVLDFIDERKKDRATSEDRDGKKNNYDPAASFSRDGEEFTIQ